VYDLRQYTTFSMGRSLSYARNLELPGACPGISVGIWGQYASEAASQPRPLVTILVNSASVRVDP
jgi:hypothetical protein